MQSHGTRIPLLSRNGSIVGYALVDDVDAEWVQQWTWRLYNDPRRHRQYAVRAFRDADGVLITVRLHREVLGLPRRIDLLTTDHINGDGLDNRRSNLRSATQGQNNQNRVLHRKNTSGYRGVSYNPDMKKWRAQGSRNGRTLYLGSYSTAEEAAEVAKAWRLEHMTHTVERI